MQLAPRWTVHGIVVGIRLPAGPRQGKDMDSPPAFGEIGREIVEMAGDPSEGRGMVAEQENATARGHLMPATTRR
jgi:hypothetical protein